VRELMSKECNVTCLGRPRSVDRRKKKKERKKEDALPRQDFVCVCVCVRVCACVFLQVLYVSTLGLGLERD